MQVHLTAEQEARLADIATKAGVSMDRLASDVVARYLEDEARFMAAVDRGLAAAERGEFIEEDKMDARVEQMFQKA